MFLNESPDTVPLQVSQQLLSVLFFCSVVIYGSQNEQSRQDVAVVN